MDAEQVHRLKNADDDTEGLDANITVQNGRVIVDLSRPVRYVQLDDQDLHRMIMSLVMAGFAAFGRDAEEKTPAKGMN